MATVAEQRRANLELLVKELGTLDAVAAAGGTSSVYLSQIRKQALDAKTGRPREMGSAMARRLERATGKQEGWLDQPPPITGGATGTVGDPLPAGVAHDTSHRPYKVPPFVKWEDVMKATEPLPDEFVLAMPDDSLAPQTPRGVELIFEARLLPQPGKGVLVQAADGRRYVRRYGEGLGGEWEAQARNDAFVTLKSGRDGLVLLAVARGRLSGDV